MSFLAFVYDVLYETCGAMVAAAEQSQSKLLGLYTDLKIGGNILQTRFFRVIESDFLFALWFEHKNLKHEKFGIKNL